MQTRLLTGRKLRWAGMMPCGMWAPNGPKVKGPTVVRAVNRPKGTQGRELAQHLNGSLKGRKMYILKIGPSIEWAVNRPKSHQADIEPKYIAGC